MLLLNRVPVEHHLAVLLNDNRCHLADDEELEYVDRHGKDEQELDLLASLLVLEVKTLFVRGQYHRSQHLQHSTLQIPEALQLVSPCIGDHVSEHDGKGPPQAAEEDDKRANIGQHCQRALYIGQELEEWDEEADEEDQIDSLDIVQHLESCY